MHRRYHIIYTLLCVIALSITACGAKSQDYAEDTPVAMSYSPQYSQYEYTFDAAKEVYSDFYGIFVQGDKLYCISRDKNNKDTLNIIDISTGEHSDRLLGRAAVYFRTVNGFAGFGSDKITLYDSNFENTGEVDLKNFIAERKAENGFFSYDSIAVDADGNIGVISRIYRLAQQSFNNDLVSGKGAENWILKTLVLKVRLLICMNLSMPMRI